MDEYKLILRKYLYYIIIGIMSMIALVFLPMLGSDVNAGWNLPTTGSGWAIYITTKLIVSCLNILMFHCFVLQGKVNVTVNENYILARQILSELEDKEYIPISPQKWHAKQYGTKATTIFIMTLLSLFAITQAVLTFDWVSMLTYLFTITMGIIFGIFQMKKEEIYWTEEYLLWAKYKQKSMEAKNDRN